MILLIVLLCIAITLSSLAAPERQFEISNAEYHFNEFIRNHNKQYVNSYETEKRFQIFKDNLEIINRRNSDDLAEHGITKFSDLTAQEFQETYGCASITNVSTCIRNIYVPTNYSNVPDTFDWRHQKTVTSVQNQGTCGACWTFSVIGSVEGKYAIKYNKLKSFSQQQLVDCDKSNGGCRGGSLHRAMDYLKKTGVMLYTDYPYVALEDLCQYDPNKKVASVTECYIHLISNEENLKKILIDNGPLSMAISGAILQHYTRGILYQCAWENLDHAVLLVGYGKNGNTPYWIFKNSYGRDWGEAGHFRVYMNMSNCKMNTPILSADVA